MRSGNARCQALSAAAKGAIRLIAGSVGAGAVSPRRRCTPARGAIRVNSRKRLQLSSAAQLVRTSGSQKMGPKTRFRAVFKGRRGPAETEIVTISTGKKMKNPNPSSFDRSRVWRSSWLRSSHWSLLLGVSLEPGDWDLELPPKSLSANHIRSQFPLVPAPHFAKRSSLVGKPTPGGLAKPNSH